MAFDSAALKTPAGMMGAAVVLVLVVLLVLYMSGNWDMVTGMFSSSDSDADKKAADKKAADKKAAADSQS